MMSQPLSLFFCYAQEDAAWQEQFEKHFAMTMREDWIQCWSNQHIGAGESRQPLIDHHLRTADLFLLFISADFLHSEDCYSAMQAALKRHQAGEALVIPILLRPVGLETTPLSELQALPRDGRPINTYSDPDEAFKQTVTEIRRVIKALRQPVVLVPCLSNQTFTERLIHTLTGYGLSIVEAECTPEPISLQEPIRKAAAVVVIASSQTEHTRTLKEVQRLVNTYQRSLLGIWVSSEEQDDGPPDSQPSQRQKWISVDPGQEEIAFQQIRTTLHRERSHHALLTITSPQEEQGTNQEQRNPYKGLDAFTAADAGDFFGRTALVDALLTTVKTTLSQEKQGKPPARLLAVVGASGSGKSSLVQAGLLPALQAGSVTQSDTWLYLDPIIPGAHPLQELASLLLEYFPDKSLEMIHGDMYSASLSGLHSYARMIAKQRGSKHVVLVVDQFEEVFTLTEQEQERQQFLDLLVTACTKPDGPLIVILTLRGDFYDRLMQYPALYTLVAEHLTPMLPMTLPDLRAIITQPATLPDVHLTFEGNLVGDLLFEVQGQIGALPLLQFTLERLVEQREGHLLTEHAYQKMGGIRGALTKHAEACYKALPSDAHRDLARTLFPRLLDPGTTEQETTRRRATLTEFAFADERQTDKMQETIDAFVKARLLTITANEKTGTITVEVSHEALIRQWPRLIDWLSRARDDISLQQNISRDATMWERNTRSGDRLYRGTELKAAQTWAQRNRPSKREAAFLRASMVRQIQALLSLIGIILLLVSSIGAATWLNALNRVIHPDPTLVTTLLDNDLGSLRYCIENASSGSTIRFASNLLGTIYLKESLSFLSDRQLTIQGPGGDKITISGSKNAYATIEVPPRATLIISGMSFKDSETVVNAFLYNEGTFIITNSVISHNKTTGDVRIGGFLNDPGLGGGVLNRGTLVVINSTISDNEVTAGWGGGIFNSGTLTLTNSRVSDNTADYSRGGGGIFNSGTLTLTNSTVSHNKSLGDTSLAVDGGIANAFESTLLLTNSTVSGNTTESNNGGIGNDGTLTLINSTISNNTAFGSNGGIGNDSALTLINSTISNNTARGGSGGGIGNFTSNYTGSGTLTVANSTISGNSASTYGGGIFNQSDTQNPSFIAQADLTFSTIYGNKAPVGGDIAIKDGASNEQLSTVKIRNSIVAADPIRPSPDISGTLISSGYNLFQNSSGATFDSVTGEPDSTDKTLSVNDLGTLFAAPVELRKNGGPTMTYMLGSSSPALGTIPLQYCQIQDIRNKQSLMYTDQRGMPRPGKNKQKCDSGAYESQVSS